MRTILTGLLIFYALILITRYAGPILFQYFLKRLSKKFGMNHQSTDKTEENPFFKKEESKKTNQKVGEYIDFEEID